MRTAAVVLLSAVGWIAVLTVTLRLVNAESVATRPWLALIQLIFVAGLSTLAGFAVGYFSRGSHWAGALLGAALSGGLIAVLAAFRWEVALPGLVGVSVALGILIVGPAWCGAWLGSRRRSAASAMPEE